MKLKNYGRNQKKRKEYIQQGWLLLKKPLISRAAFCVGCISIVGKHAQTKV